MKKIFRAIFEELLISCAKIIIWRHQPTIIAITGSAGKTTTKIVIGNALARAKGEEEVLVGYGNLGTVSGVPLSLLKINVNLLDQSPIVFIISTVFLFIVALIKTVWYLIYPFYPQIAVLEVSADRVGDIQKTAAYLQPEISVFTNIGAAHLEYFGTIEGVRKEKEQLAIHTQKDGLIIINGVDENCRKLAAIAPAKVVLISEEDDFAVSATQEIGRWLGLDEDKIKKGAESARLPQNRFDIIAGVKKTTIVDSSYNANPVSVEYILDKFNQYAKSGGRKIIILGDMLELGKDSLKYHKEIGEKAKSYCDYLIAIGPNSKEMPADYYCQNISDAYQHLLQVIAPGDTILVKASHGMHLNKLVDKLKV